MRKNTENEAIRTTKRSVMAAERSKIIRYSGRVSTGGVTSLNDVGYRKPKMKFVAKMKTANSAAPRRERSHWRLTFAIKTNGIGIKNRTIRAIS